MAVNKHQGSTLDSQEVQAASVMAEDDDFELIRGTGNVYADLGMKNPEERQRRAIEAARVAMENRK